MSVMAGKFKLGNPSEQRGAPGKGEMMTNAQKIERYRLKLADARKEQMRQCQWIGLRFGAIEATKIAERKARRIDRAIQQLEFAEHNAGNCDPATCSDCATYKLIPDQWIPRGAKMEDAKLTF